MDAELDAILAAWREAEGRLKRTERVRGELIIPSVNELRYAGYHLLEALGSKDQETRAENLVKSKRHCQRATYDAVEAEALYLIRQFDKFRDNYKDMVLSEVADLHWIDLSKAVRAAQKCVRSAQEPESKDEYYRRLIPHCDALEGVLDTCEAARDELNKKRRIDEERRRNEQAAKLAESQRTSRRYKITTAVAVVAAVAAVGKCAADKRAAVSGDLRPLSGATSASPANLQAPP